MQVNRRHFIYSSLAIAASTTGWHLFTGQNSLDIEVPDTLLRTLSFLPPMPGSKQIATHYIKKAPEKQELAHLMHDVFNDLDLSKANKTQIQKTVIDSINKDFSTGQTIEINGWLLSLTEVKLCMLFYISGLS